MKFCFFLFLLLWPDYAKCQVSSNDTINALGLRNSRISMSRVLANPSLFDGLEISVSGYLHWRFEDAVLYLTKTDADYLISENAFWIIPSKDVVLYQIALKGEKSSNISIEYFDGKYVTITGIFNSTRFGHMGANAGIIVDATRISELRQWYDGRDDLWEDKLDGRGLRQIKK